MLDEGFDVRIRMLQSIVALSLTFALIVIASVPASAQISPFSGGMRQIPASQYFVVKDFIANGQQASINFEVQVMNPTGSTVDVLLMNKYNFDSYKSGAVFFVYDAVSKLDINFATGSTGPLDLVDGNEYFLVIDNTNRPTGGSQGNVEVQVMYFFDGTNIQNATDWGIILIILAVVTIAIAAIVVLVIVFLRKPKSSFPSGPLAYGQQYQQPGMKTCRTCGTQAPTTFAYCPKCGNRY